MTPEEAIKDLKYDNERCLRICEGACLNIEKNQCNCRDGVIERMLDELLQYREIGTVEECREAVEKQEAERVEYETNAVFSNGFSHYRIGKCPICDNRYNSNDEINYCSKCGQKLDWSEEDE